MNGRGSMPVSSPLLRALAASSLLSALLASCGSDGGGGAAGAAPSGLTAEPLSGGVHVTWKDNSNDETGFDLERKDTGDFVVLATVPFDAAQYHDSNVSPGKSYTYRVRGKTPGGFTPYSNQATV